MESTAVQLKCASTTFGGEELGPYERDLSATGRSVGRGSRTQLEGGDLLTGFLRFCKTVFVTFFRTSA